MINYQLVKVFQKVAVIFLIAVFSVTGIVACSADATEPSASQSTIPDTGPTTPDEPTPTFDEGTYYNLYVPWTTWREGSGWITNVSWQDTNALTKLWKELIDGGKHNDGKRWFIRDGDNRQSDHRTGNYYYFDKNFDIVHAGNYADKLKVKQFLGGVIVKYSGGDGKRHNGAYTVGGLYKTLLNKEKDNSQGQQGYTKYNNDNLNEFMRAIHRWEEGDLSIILMNVTSGNDVHQNEFGVDEYYCTVDDNYRKDPTYFLGQDPTTYLGKQLPYYSGEKLNVRVNHSWKIWGGFQFRFVYNFPYAWQLE